MRTVDIDEVAKNLLSLIDDVASGETLIVEKGGQAIAKIVPLRGEDRPSRLGFLTGYGQLPDNFGVMHAEAISDLFENR